MVIFSGVAIYKLSHVLYLESLCRESERGKQRNGRSFLGHPLQDNPEENIESNRTRDYFTDHGPVSDHSENESEDHRWNQVVRYAVDFKEVRSSEDFNVLVNGSVINSELSKYLQIKYDHELCSSRKCFLHDHIIEDLNCKLVGGMLAETINIADGIRAPTLTTFQENFAASEKTLKAFH